MKMNSDPLYRSAEKYRFPEGTDMDNVRKLIEEYEEKEKQQQKQ